MTTQVCTLCKVEQPLSAYALQGYRKKDGTRSPRRRCKTCVKAADDVVRRQANHRANNITRHGITVAQYDEMYENQLGLCASCAEYREVLFIDHDHRCCPGRTGCGRCVRGLLCGSCNSALGYAKDSPARLRQLAAYREDSPV